MCLLLQRQSFTHKMRDGWGLATDGKVLFGSDGTSRLYQLDPESLEGIFSYSHARYSIRFETSFLFIDTSFDAVTKTVTVKYQENEVSYINELEYINGEVWANVWQVRVAIMQYLTLTILFSCIGSDFFYILEQNWLKFDMAIRHLRSLHD